MNKNQTQHTPGSWKFSFESIDPEWAVVTAMGGRVVANVNSESGPDIISAPAFVKMPQEANAKLIASSPELLEALINLLQFEVDCKPLIERHPSAKAPWDAAREAIKKATGVK